MPYRVLDHTADTGIEATSGSVAGLMDELATGMFALIAPVEPGEARVWVGFEVESGTLPDLVVDILSGLLLRAEVEDLIFSDFRVDVDLEALRSRVEAGGLPVGSVEPVGPPIKAVTYHDLVVEKRGRTWRGRVYFDV